MIGEDTKIIGHWGELRPIKDFYLTGFPIWTGTEFKDCYIDRLDNQACQSVKLLNGLEIICSPDQLFKTKRLGAIIKAKDLKRNHLLEMNLLSPNADNLRLTGRYSSLYPNELYGELIGFIYATGGYFDFASRRKEVISTLESLLDISQVKYKKSLYFDQTNRTKIELQDQDFIEEIEEYKITDRVKDYCWTSKPFLKGFIRSLFSFSEVSTDMLSIKGNKENTLLKDFQQILLLFGINSNYLRGLRFSQLMVCQGNAYKLANMFDLYDSDRLFEGLDVRTILEYTGKKVPAETQWTKVLNSKPIENSTLYSVSASQYMANGVILQNI